MGMQMTDSLCLLPSTLADRLAGFIADWPLCPGAAGPKERGEVKVTNKTGASLAMICQWMGWDGWVDNVSISWAISAPPPRESLQ